MSLKSSSKQIVARNNKHVTINEKKSFYLKNYGTKKEIKQFLFQIYNHLNWVTYYYLEADYEMKEMGQGW